MELHCRKTGNRSTYSIIGREGSVLLRGSLQMTGGVCCRSDAYDELFVFCCVYLIGPFSAAQVLRVPNSEWGRHFGAGRTAVQPA